MSNPPQCPSATPRGFTLAGLVLLVLGVHGLLLSGGLSVFSPGPPEPPGTRPRVAAVQTRTLGPGSVPAPDPELPAAGSTARWITPAREPSPAPAPAHNTPEPHRQPGQTRPPKVAAAPKEPAAPAADLQGSSALETVDAPPAMPGDETKAAVTPEETQPPTEASAPAESAPIAAQPMPASPPAAASRSEPDDPQAPASPPASAQLNYEVTGRVKGANYSASARLDWRLDGDTYDARMEVRLFLLGSRVQTSTGRTNEHGLLPERFTDKSRSERAAHFDHVGQQIRFSANTPDVALQPGAQDRLSVFLQLAAMLNANPGGFRPGQTVALQVAGTGGADIWRFQVGEVETLTLPAGDLPALHLVREPRQEYDTRVDVWLAPGLAHLPVRLRVTQHSGDSVDQHLRQMP